MTNRRLPSGTQLAVTSALERLLGLRTDLTGFYRLAAGDAQLGPLAQRFRGFKPPRFPTVFETLVNAIACQQITLTLGIRVLNRLAATYGRAARRDQGPAHAFPQPDALAGLEPERAPGGGAQPPEGPCPPHAGGARSARGRWISEPWRPWTMTPLWPGCVNCAGLAGGRRSTSCFGGWDGYTSSPADDVGARNNLRHWLDLPEPLDYEGVRRVLARWAPYGGLIYLHLLLDHLATKGWLPVRRGCAGQPWAGTRARWSPWTRGDRGGRG